MSLKVRCLVAWWIITLLASAHLPAAAAPIQLLEAVRNGDPEAVRTLLQTDVDVNAHSYDSPTCCWWAVAPASSRAVVTLCTPRRRGSRIFISL